MSRIHPGQWDTPGKRNGGVLDLSPGVDCGLNTASFNNVDAIASKDRDLQLCTFALEVFKSGRIHFVVLCKEC